MNTLAPSKTLAVLVFALPSILACDVQGKQIGQLDDETDTWSQDSFEVSDDGSDLDCEAEVQSLRALVDEHLGQHCAALVFFDFETFEPHGWYLKCAAGDLGLNVDEAQALTSWGGEEISEPEGWPAEDRSFLFYAFPNPSGGVGWVSSHLGLLFDASIVVGGLGEVHHPQQLRDPSELGGSCGPLDVAFELRGYDLTKELVVTDFDLPPGAYEALADAVTETALLRLGEPLGFFTFDIVAYPRTIAEFDPSTADYVVVVEWDK